MSLTAWYPCIGNFINQGLNDVQKSVSESLFVSDGKIGKQCLHLYNQTIDTSITYDKWDYINTSISFGGWFKPNRSELTTIANSFTYESNYGTCGGTLLGDDSYGGFALRWESNSILNDGALNAIKVFAHMRDTTGSAVGGNYNNNTATIPFDEWSHIIVTYDNTTIKLYVNGELKVTYSDYISHGRTFRQGTFKICQSSWWGGNGRSSAGSFNINDIRLYDHVLSAKEIKEISKGLVLHYPMREGGQSLATSYAYPTFNTGYSTSYWNHWNASGANGSYSQNSDTNYIYKFSNSDYSHRISNDPAANGDYLLYQEKLFAGGYRSLQAIIKESNGLPINENICYPAWNGSTNLSLPSRKWTKIVDLGNGFYWCLCEGINQTTSPTSANSHLVGIYVKPGYTIYLSEAYVEDNKQFCTLPFFKNHNLINSLKAGGQTTVSNLKVTTSGTNADTYFYFNLSEPLISGETYTLSCVASNIPDGEYWGFPIANQNNVAITMAIYNGVNTYTFTANDTAANKLQIIMDDNYRGNAHVNQCVFDNWELAKSNSIDDCSGYGNNAHLNGSISYFKSEGRNSKCYKLMSTNVGNSTLAGASYIKSPLSLPASSALTIAFWTNPETWSRGGMIATTSQADYPTDYTTTAVHNYDGWLRFNDVNGDYVQFNYNALTTANEWHHYAFTFNGINLKVYKDGVEQTSISQSFTSVTKLATFNSLYIGLSKAGGVYRTTRSMWSDFRVYTTCLSDADIKELATVAASIDNDGNFYSYEVIE